MFDRPVRSVDSDERPIRATLEPPVEGRWEWLGTRALRFVPAKELPAATRFKVTVPAETATLSDVYLKARTSDRDRQGSTRRLDAAA